MTHTVGILGHDGFINTYASVMVDIAWFCEADDWVDKDIGFSLASSTDGQFTVGTVHGVAGLESDDLPPGELLEVGTEFSGCDYCNRSIGIPNSL